MALVLLVGGTTKGISDPTGLVSAYVFDATVSLIPRLSSAVTQHPVEQGANISDHVITKNLIIDLEAVVSAYPITGEGGIGTSGVDPDNATQAIETNLSGSGRINSAYQALAAAQKGKTLITVASELDVYANCIITSLSFPRDANVGDSLKVTATLEQVQLVQAQTSTISPELLAAASQNVKVGDKSVVDTTRNPTVTSSRFVAAVEEFAKGLLQSVTPGE